jgi:hypothetical protein
MHETKVSAANVVAWENICGNWRVEYSMVSSKNSIVEEEGRDSNGAVVSVVVITLKRKRKKVMGGVGSGQHRGRERTDERRGRQARPRMLQLAATNQLFSEKQHTVTNIY